MNFFYFIIATVVGTANIGVFCAADSSTTSSITRTVIPWIKSSSDDGTLNQHRSTMVESENFFQIQSSEDPNLCMEVFKTLDQVGRIWLRPCKSKGESGIERQMFVVTNDGKLHPSAKPSSCLFLYSKNKFRYRRNCDGIIHNKKNQFMYNFFKNIMFVMGDVTKVMTAWKLQEKKEIKLQKISSSNIANKRWTIHFERDRILQPGDCGQTNPVTTAWPSKYHTPTSTSTNSYPTSTDSYSTNSYPTSSTDSYSTNSYPTSTDSYSTNSYPTRTDSSYTTNSYTSSTNSYSTNSSYPTTITPIMPSSKYPPSPDTSLTSPPTNPPSPWLKNSRDILRVWELSRRENPTGGEKEFYDDIVREYG